MNNYLKFTHIHAQYPIIRHQIWMNLRKNGLFEDINHKWLYENKIHMSRGGRGGGGFGDYMKYRQNFFFNPPHTNTTKKLDKFRSWTSDDLTLLFINFRNLFVVRIFRGFFRWCTNFLVVCEFSKILLVCEFVH